MKYGKWAALTGIALAVGIAIWGFWGGGLDQRAVHQPKNLPPAPTQPTTPTSGAEESAETSVSKTKPPATRGEQAEVKVDHAKPEPGDSRYAIVREASAASSAVDRARALEELTSTDPVLAARKLLELAAFCAPQQLKAEGSPNTSSRVLEQRQEWCEGLQLSTETMKARLEELTQIDEDLEGEAAQIERLARDPYLGRQYEMEEELASAAEDERSDRFTEWVRRARDFDEINNLATLNMLHAQRSGGRPLWELGANLKSQLYPQAELLKAQRVALILYGCRRFGGCASGQYITMLICAMGVFGQCALGDSLPEHIYLTSTPATYGLAQEILTRI